MPVDSINLELLVDTIQDANINFLVGSGVSSPFLETLGNIEGLLSELENARLDESRKKLIRASLFKRYYEQVIEKNLRILRRDPQSSEVLSEYKSFLKHINSILLIRKNSLLRKQANLFTTNIDIFFERALDDLGLESNDGFAGRFEPVFSHSNFRKAIYQRSLHFDNTSEVPVFNLFKLHGSLTWRVVEKLGTRHISFSPNLELVEKIGRLAATQEIPPADKRHNLDDLIRSLDRKRLSRSIELFLNEYQNLPIINPTKEKFRLTLLNQTHYELLRMYSNELEKENTLLFVLGFSFADEHIRDVTVRCVNSNPTLTVYIIAHTFQDRMSYEALLNVSTLKNKNIRIISPLQMEGTGKRGRKLEAKYDLATVNSKIFDEVLRKIGEANR